MRPPLSITAAIGTSLLASLAVAGDGADTSPVPPKPNATLWWGDFDGDGKDDVWVVRADDAGQLLRNLGDGRFEDATERLGLAGVRGSHMAVFADANGDGRTDLYLPAWQAESRLFVQGEGGSFADATDAAGLPRWASPLDATFVDVDGDALPDLHLVTLEADLVYRNAGRGRFERLDLGLPRTAATGVDRPADLDAARAQRGLGAIDPLGQGYQTFGGGGGVGTTTTQILCAIAVQDQAAPANCMLASSDPQLGMLYPLSTDWYIEAGSGLVGLGTTSPAERLDVVGSVRADTFRSTVSSGPPLVVVSTDLVANLNADMLDGFHASDFRTSGSPITGVDVLDGSLTGADLAADSIDASHVAPGSLTSAELAANSVGGLQLQTNAVTSSKVADGSLTAADLASSSVGTAEIQVGAVDSARIANESITAFDLAPNSVGASEIATSAVGTSEIQDGSITAADLASNSVGASEIATSAVGTSEIQDGSVTAADLAPGAVGSSELGSGVVFNSNVNNAAAISGTKIVPSFGSQNVVTTGNVGAGTTNPAADLHVQGDALLGTALIAPSESSSGDDSQLVMAEDNDGTFGMTWFYDGGFNRLQLHRRTSGVNDTTPWLAIERDTGNTSIGNQGFQQGRLTVNGVNDTLNPALQVFDQGNAAVRATTAQSNGTAVYGDNNAAGGAGVWGICDDTGVYGQTDGPGGYGVHGYVNFTTGVNYGVIGENANTGGVNYGVYGRTNSTSGRGMRGEAFAASGNTYGVQGRVHSPSGYGLISYGSSGTTGQKNFIQPHPADPSKEIRFASLEGNESGTYFRGSTRLQDGQAIIEVPEEFRLVSMPDGITVQLTPYGPRADLWIEAKDLDRIVVRGAYDVEFDYMVNGVRRGYSEHRAIAENLSFVPEVRGEPAFTQYPDEYRQILVDSGILNPDFTPNEVVAAALGWELVDPADSPALSSKGAARQAYIEQLAEMDARHAAEALQAPAKD